MKQACFSSVALMLAVTSSAWAGVEPYPDAVQAEQLSAKTRSEVIAELREAQRLGMISSGEGDFPSVKVSQQPADSATLQGDARTMRAKIHAETIEAANLGLLSFGNGNPPVATAEQEKLIAAAGELAVNLARVAPHAALAQPAGEVNAWTEVR
jgi:hypothetical protein